MRRPWWLFIHVALLVSLFAIVGVDAKIIATAVAYVVVFVALVVQKRRVVERAQRAAELNRDVAALFALEIPERPQSPPPRRRRIRPEFVFALVVTIAVAAITLRGRDAVPERSQWAAQADAVCAEMETAYDYANSWRGPPVSELPLSELAEIRRAGVEIQNRAVQQMRRTLDRSDAAAVLAVQAFEWKVAAEARAVEAAENGDHAGFADAMEDAGAIGIHARARFSLIRADRCSRLM